MPLWITLFTASSAAWRVAVEALRWHLPPTWLRSLVAIAAMQAGRDDEAIAKFNAILTTVPACADCLYNLGLTHS